MVYVKYLFILAAFMGYFHIQVSLYLLNHLIRTHKFLQTTHEKLVAFSSLDKSHSLDTLVQCK